MNAKKAFFFSTQWITVKESPRDSVAVFFLRRSGSELAQQYEALIRQQHFWIDRRELDGSFRLVSCPVTGELDEGE